MPAPEGENVGGSMLIKINPLVGEDLFLVGPEIGGIR